MTYSSMLFLLYFVKVIAKLLKFPDQDVHLILPFFEVVKFLFHFVDSLFIFLVCVCETLH